MHCKSRKCARAVKKKIRAKTEQDGFHTPGGKKISPSDFLTSSTEADDKVMAASVVASLFTTLQPKG